MPTYKEIGLTAGQLRNALRAVPDDARITVELDVGVYPVRAVRAGVRHYNMSHGRYDVPQDGQDRRVIIVLATHASFDNEGEVNICEAKETN